MPQPVPEPAPEVVPEPEQEAAPVVAEEAPPVQPTPKPWPVRYDESNELMAQAWRNLTTSQGVTQEAQHAVTMAETNLQATQEAQQASTDQEELARKSTIRAAQHHQGILQELIDSLE